jgi:N-acyl-D-aspartate/D-glutamate deacylase
MKADLAVFDLDALAAKRPEIRHDLPAGGRRFLQGARGYRAMIKSGSLTYRDGEATGALPGKLVRAV